MRRVALGFALTLSSLVFVPTVLAAGGPAIPYQGMDPTSVLGPDGTGPRYATISDGSDTHLLQIDQDGGQITGSRSISGNFSIPVVAMDGTSSGLSADGGTLALIDASHRFRDETSTFRMVDLTANGAMLPAKPFTLEGNFSFDALSPDGSTLFLIEYTSADPNDYVVREYDLERERLIQKPVLVPDEEPDEMRGAPLTRATSPDGRWEYTLYDGGGQTPFVHALDTRGRTARCIDLDMLPARTDLSNTRLDLEGRALAVVRAGVSVASVDLASFHVSVPKPPSATATPTGSDDGFPLAAAASVGLALLVTTAIFAAVLRRGRRASAATG